MRQQTTTTIIVGLMVVLTTSLLVAQRIESAPERPPVVLLEVFGEMPSDATCVPSEPITTLSTCATHGATFRVGDTHVAIESGSSLTVEENHLRFDAGRVVIDGAATLTVRDVAIATDGVVTLVHYSWLNTVDVLVLSGTAMIDQGGAYAATVTAGNAVRVDTLSPYDAIAPTTFSIDAPSVKAFYDQALRTW